MFHVKRTQFNALTILPTPAKWSLLALLALAGCHPSLIGVSDKAVDRFASIVEKAVQEAPEPFVEVNGPPAEKYIGWWEVAALGAWILLNLADRRWWHTRQAKKNGNG